MTDPDPAASTRLKFTEYEALTQPKRWIPREVDWHEWAQAVRPAPYLSKETAPLWGLYTLREGGGRSTKDVKEYWGLALDFDDVPLDRVAETAGLFDSAGLTYLWHSTWSHTLPGKGECRRLLVPLARPVSKAEYVDLIQAVRATYAPDLDANTTQRSQAFFVPSYHPDRAELVECWYQPGKPLDPASLPKQAAPRPDRPMRLVASGGVLLEPPPEPTNDPVRVVDREVWEQLARRWKTRANPKTTELGVRLRKVCEGIRYAQHGERDRATWGARVRNGRRIPGLFD
jgi:hypothetical protein